MVWMENNVYSILDPCFLLPLFWTVWPIIDWTLIKFVLYFTEHRRRTSYYIYSKNSDFLTYMPWNTNNSNGLLSEVSKMLWWNGQQCRLWSNCTRIWFYTISLRKHAYSNILKTLQPKKGKFSDKKFWYFSYFFSKHRLWVLVRTASARRF